MTDRLPHDSWAEHYESVMRQTWGDLYTRLTSCTLAQVRRLVARPGRVLDVGAGCGRLTLPLAEDGWRVSAVERSGPMAAELERAAARLGDETPGAAARIHVHRTLEAARDRAPYDLALCVFTVLAYSVTRSALDELFRSVASLLAAGAPFLLDVPGPEVFESLEIETADLIRDVHMEHRADGLIEYSEDTLIRTPDGPARYRDMFLLRRWSLTEVRDALKGAGFDGIRDVTDDFDDFGARYLVARTAPVSSKGVPG